MKDKDELFSILACVECKTRLIQKDAGVFICSSCQKTYLIQNGIPLLLDDEMRQKIEQDIQKNTDTIARISPFLRRIKEIVQLNLYCNPSRKKILTRYFKSYLNKPEFIILHIGSKKENLGDNVINLDIIPFENVDVVSDAHKMGFLDESIDCVFIPGVFEHVQDSHLMINEIHRVLKRNGTIIVDMPFLQGYHPDPLDFRRYTIEGIENLCASFEKLESGVGGGPASALVWILREFFAILFSFNNIYLHRIIKIGVSWLLFPLKYLDLFMSNLRFAKNIASGFYYVGKKV